jgi:hypothetical protein
MEDIKLKNKLSLLLMLLLVLTLLIGSSFQSVAMNFEENVRLSNEKKYEYPVKPGTEEWLKLGNKEAREKKCQIPEKRLMEMTTEQLIEAVLEYPYNIDMYCFDTLQAGFEVVKSRFNGLQELLNRKDNGSVLLKIYSGMDVKNLQEIKSMDYIFDLSFIELLLAQQSVYNNLDKMEKDELKEEVKDKYDEKGKSKDVYGFTRNTYYITESQTTQLLYVETTVETQIGNDVDAAICIQDYTPYEKDGYKSSLQNSYPSITIVGDPTGNYNCHSYAYYNKSTNNDRWVMQPGAFITDGSFTEIDNPTYYNLEAGTRFFYNTTNPNNNHSAIFLQNLSGPVDPNKEYYQLAYVESKWGPNCLVRHWIGVGPYDTANIVSYKKN